MRYLKEMGFTDFQATKALDYSNDDLNTAIALLLEMDTNQNQQDTLPVLTKPTNPTETTNDEHQNAAPSESEKPKNPTEITKDENHNADAAARPEIDDLPDDKLCVVCLEYARNTLIAPCGHVCVCFECADTIKTSRQPCPMCRGPIEMVYRVYYS